MQTYSLRPALVIVDMQNCFMAEGGSFHKLGYRRDHYQQIIPAVQEAYRRARALRIPVIFSKAVRERSGIDLLDRVHRILPPKRLERIRRAHIAIRDTWDADIIEALQPASDDLIVEKRRDSIFQDTELELWLRAMRVDTLVFTGIDTAICVESSLRDAFNRGYDVVLLADATASREHDFYETTLREVQDNFGLVLQVSQFFDRLERQRNGRFLLQRPSILT